MKRKKEILKLDKKIERIINNSHIYPKDQRNRWAFQFMHGVAHAIYWVLNDYVDNPSVEFPRKAGKK